MVLERRSLRGGDLEEGALGALAASSVSEHPWVVSKHSTMRHLATCDVCPEVFLTVPDGSLGASGRTVE